MVFPLLGWLGSALGLGTGVGSLFTKGAASTALSAVGGLQAAITQANLEVPPNLTPYEEALYRAKAGLPPIIRGLIPTGGGAGAGGGGGGGDGGGAGAGGGGGGGGDGQEIKGTSLFSPSPEGGESLFSRIQRLGTGSPAGITGFPSDAPGGFTGAELSQFESPAAAPQDFGTDFGFNQGGIVSLLPRRATPVRSPPISYRRY